MGESVRHKLILLSQSELRSRFDYDPNTGDLYWSYTKGRARCGCKVGRVNHAGYIVTSLDGINHMVHRVIWKLVNGEDPDGFIDHINGDKKDNRISNLRILDKSRNNINAKFRSDSKTGVTGVTLNKQTGLWEAFISFKNSRRFLGYFESLKEAAYHRYAAEQCIFNEEVLTSSALDYISSNKDDVLVRGKTRKMNKNNTVGVAGVTKVGDMWVAQIKSKYRHAYLYKGPSLEEAKLHRLAAEQCLSLANETTMRYAARLE